MSTERPKLIEVLTRLDQLINELRAVEAQFIACSPYVAQSAALEKYKKWLNKVDAIKMELGQVKV